MTITAWLGSLTLLLYIAITVRIFTFDSPRKPATAQKIQLSVLLLAALISHACLLYTQLLNDKSLNLGFFNMVSLISWLVVLLLRLALLQKSVESLLAVFAPITAVTVLLALYFPSEGLLTGHLAGGVKMHIVTSVLAYSILVLAALQAIFMAVQEYKLRHKRPTWIMQHLPPLQSMETLLFQLLQAGWFFLTLGLISGSLFLEDMFAQHLAHKTVLSFIAWLIFATLLFGRWRYGWRGRRAIRWTWVGFACLMLGYLGSKFIYEWIK